jgi:hypothetical protein
MAFHVTTQFGAMERNVRIERMAAILGTIDPRDEEHVNVSLTHESEWCIGVFASGLVVYEKLGAGEPRHMRLASPVEALPLWQSLSRGELAELEALPWLPGCGVPAARSPETLQ